MLRLASLTAALALVGCADSGDEGMIVIGNLAIEGDSCTVGASGGAFVPHGMINWDSNSGYVLTPLVQSRISASIGGGSGGQGSSDPIQRTIFLTSADVKLKAVAAEIEQGGTVMTPAYTKELPPFSVLFSGSVSPNGTTGTILEIMSRANMRELITGTGANPDVQNIRVEVQAEVTMRGTMGGDEVTSSPFHYPISVCTDCVVGTCPTGVESDANPCNPYQDGLLCLAPPP